MDLKRSLHRKASILLSLNLSSRQLQTLVVALIALLFMAGADAISFTDWTNVNTAADTASGTLNGIGVMMTGFDIQGGTTNGTSTSFNFTVQALGQFNLDRDGVHTQIGAEPVPEPGTMSLVGIGLAVLILLSRRAGQRTRLYVENHSQT